MARDERERDEADAVVPMIGAGAVAAAGVGEFAPFPAKQRVARVLRAFIDSAGTVRPMNTSTTNLTDEDRHTVATYLSDVLALEQHISAPIESQLSSEDHQQFPEATAVIQRIKSVSTSHISALEAQLKAAGGSAGHGVKSGWAQFVGGGAAALNNVRKTKVSKSLRDDYTALSLEAISYTMLHATAAGLGDGSTAALAKRHLEDITPIIVEISKTVPTVVLQELKASGENVSISAAELTKQAGGEAWSPSNTGGTS